MIAPDFLRAAAFVLYFLILGQTVAIIWAYLRYRHHAKASKVKHGGLLPNHVALLGVSLLGADTVAVWQNYIRVGDEFTWYVVVNPVLFAVTNIGLYLVMRYEWRRLSLHRSKQGYTEPERSHP